MIFSIINNIRKSLRWIFYNPFKDVLKEKRILEVIKSIKKVYGQGVVIITCEELAGECKGNCKKLVTEYIAPTDLSGKSTSETKNSSTHYMAVNL